MAQDRVLSSPVANNVRSLPVSETKNPREEPRGRFSLKQLEQHKKRNI
jgi:hypothetical protein